MRPTRLVLGLMLAACASGQQAIVHLRLGTVGNHTQFHIGQAVPITLDFETEGPKAFRVNTDVRLRQLKPQGPDLFSATPRGGWVDPLAWLHWTMNAWGHGPPIATLDSLHPVHIERDLNEFIVFRRPGHYTVHVVSSRVFGQSLQSNDIALNILPRDEAWTARKFKAAKATLEAGKPPKKPERVFYQDKENAQIDAVRTLRYLGTESAVAYLASIYGQHRRTDYEIEYALYASPYPDVAAKSLERQMTDPELALTQSYMTTLLELKARALADKNGHPLSTTERIALDESLNRKAFEAAAHKSLEAKADTYYFLFVTGSRSMRGSPQVRQKLIPSLPFASDYAVQELLTSSWESIEDAGPSLVAVLKQVAYRSSAPWALHVSGIALLRLRQLDPAAANEITRDTLLSGRLMSEDPQLLDFSFAPSQEMDEALVSQYRQGKKVDARIARFASAAVEQEVWRAYDTRLKGQPQARPACVTPLFAYFFRVDASAAARRLAEMRQTLPGSCTALRFYNLERQLMSPGLEQQLTLDAKSRDQSIRGAAFHALGVAGSPSVLPVLMQALKSAPEAKRSELILAVVHGRNWVIPQPDFAELSRVCVGTQSCGEVRRIQRDSQPPYRLEAFDFAGHEGFWLNNHEVDSLEELEQKLAQFKPGSTFRWITTSTPMSRDELRRRDAAHALLAAHGMTLLDQ